LRESCDQFGNPYGQAIGSYLSMLTIEGKLPTCGE
jgi:hypothetical protein